MLRGLARCCARRPTPPQLRAALRCSLQARPAAVATPNCERGTHGAGEQWLAEKCSLFSRAPPARDSRASAAGITPHLSARAAPENFRPRRFSSKIPAISGWFAAVRSRLCVGSVGGWCNTGCKEAGQPPQVQQHRAAARDWQSAPRAQRAHGVRATHSRRLAERRISMGSDAMTPLPLGRNDRLLEPVTLAWSRRRGARFFTRKSRDLCRLVWWRLPPLRCSMLEKIPIYVKVNRSPYGYRYKL